MQGWEIGRDLFFIYGENEIGDPTYNVDFWAALYFSTFLVLSSVILLNIVMAVLVDEFIRCVEAEKQADRLEQLADLSAQSCFLNTLDPLLRELCVSSTNLDAINSRIADLFHFCQSEPSGLYHTIVHKPEKS